MGYEVQYLKMSNRENSQIYFSLFQDLYGGGQATVLPHLCCDAIPQQDFNPILFPISVQV